jgi:hypothetical protein
MNPFDALLLAAAIAAVAGALARDPAAAALLGSNAFTYALCLLGVPFNFVLWVVVDLMAMLFIIRRDMSRRDLVVLALYLPIWPCYFEWNEVTSRVVIVLVSVQMFITFPVERARGVASKCLAALWHHDDGLQFAVAR